MFVPRDHLRWAVWFFASAGGMLFLAGSGAIADDASQVVVHPKRTDAILANPDMGWETFHRTADKDDNLPAWIPSTVHYLRWGWAEVEPRAGAIDFDMIDGVLRATHDAGQKLAFRIMCCSTSPGHPYHPAWLKEIGGRVVKTQRRDGPTVEVPDLDDPKILNAHLDLIQRLGARYDGHPDITEVDLGSVGWWGEWHMSGSKTIQMPTLQTQRRIVDAYLASFKKTPLVMLIGGGPMLAHAVQHGTGWRADCLGDMGGFSKRWCHMRMGYPDMLPEAHAVDAWQHGPVAWETCWDMRKWVNEGWSLRYIFNYALALHGSYINNKSAPLPDRADVRPEVERFLRRLGYRLVLNELRHPAAVAAGGALKLEMKWQNMGSAPCYRPFHLAYRLTDQQGKTRVVVSDVTVNHWMPGTVEVFTKAFLENPPDLPPGKVYSVGDSIALPADLQPGPYELAVGVVAEGDTRPIVQLGIARRDAASWYPVSRFRVQ